MAASRRQSHRRGSTEILKFATTTDFTNYKSGDAQAGDRFFDSTLGVTREYDGSTWNIVTSSSTAASHVPVYAGTFTTTGTATSEVFTLNGIVPTDKVLVTPLLPSVGAVNGTAVSTNSITVNSTNAYRVGDKLSYVVFRAV
jgi:hypothetical protein